MSRLNSSAPLTSEPTPVAELDPIFKNQIDNLYRLNLYGRWLVIVALWLTIGVYSLWGLRYPLALIHEDFTWAAVKYGLIGEPIPAFGLCLCVGMMAGTLVGQSRNIIWGIPKQEQQRLTQQVGNIRKQGNSHPLWKWVVK